MGIERLEDHDVELGYWLGEPYWGRGYASEAAAAAVDIGFEDMGLTCMTSGHFEENPASGRVLARRLPLYWAFIAALPCARP